VPGSTFRYGSHFCRVTLKPRLSRRQPIEEAATPFPSEDTTPPVTKIYFGAILIARFALPGLSALRRIDVHRIMAATSRTVKSNSSPQNRYFFFEPVRNLFSGYGFVASGIPMEFGACGKCCCSGNFVQRSETAAREFAI
jgi:hypothetical protein